MISAIIMASGSADRMGQDKLQLLYKGETLLQRIMKTACACPFDRVVLVVSNEVLMTLDQSYPLQTVLNKKAHLGQSESIKSGLINAPNSQGYMFLTADQPLLDTETILLLMNQFKLNTDKIIVPSFRDKTGSPVIFPSCFKEELLVLQGDVGGRSIIRSHPEAVHPVEIHKEHVLIDVDTLGRLSKDYKIKG